jgi:hypothetical protein
MGGNWLKSLPADVKPTLLRICSGNSIVGLAILVERKYWRYRCMPVRETHLNATGISHLDALMIEHNDFLLDQELPPEFRNTILQKLLADNLIEEFHVGGVSPVEFNTNPTPTGFDAQVLTRECRGVDLNKVRQAGDYIGLISANSRNKIRKSLRECEKIGNLRLEFANNLGQAEKLFNELCLLHNQTWAQRGLTGAFDNIYLSEFHRNLIRDRLQHGEIQLVAMFIDDLLLGVIYNFVYRGHIYNYQSGLNYKSNINKCKPGLVIHTLAIQHYADAGYFYYDLLAGDSQYKRTLATDGASL